MKVVIKRTRWKTWRFISVFAINNCICQNAVFEFVRSCRDVCRYHCFEGKWCLCSQGHVYEGGCGHVTQACYHEAFIHIHRGVKNLKLKLEIPCSPNCRFPLKTDLRTVYIRQWLALNVEAVRCIKMLDISSSFELIVTEITVDTNK
jgi:hypothetical protein